MQGALVRAHIPKGPIMKFAIAALVALGVGGWHVSTIPGPRYQVLCLDDAGSITRIMSHHADLPAWPECFHVRVR